MNLSALFSSSHIMKYLKSGITGEYQALNSLSTFDAVVLWRSAVQSLANNSNAQETPVPCQPRHVSALSGRWVASSLIKILLKVPWAAVSSLSGYVICIFRSCQIDLLQTACCLHAWQIFYSETWWRQLGLWDRAGWRGERGIAHHLSRGGMPLLKVMYYYSLAAMYRCTWSLLCAPAPPPPRGIFLQDWIFPNVFAFSFPLTAPDVYMCLHNTYI